MKLRVFFTSLAILALTSFPPDGPNREMLLFAAEPVFSGAGEAKATFKIDDGDTGSYAFEQFANLRFKVAVGEKGTFYGAVNTIANAGSTQELTLGGELERLYMEIRGEKVDVDAGLMRIAFGYGQGFRPTDVFALPNPLYPNARPKGMLGALLAWYPLGDAKLQGFAVNRTDQTVPEAGLSTDFHTRVGSLQTLYILTVPTSDGTDIVHRTGVSVKFDLVVGFTVDALYTSGTKLPEIAAGIDYSLADGKIYLLAQYFFNGASSSTPGAPGTPGLQQRHYMLGTVAWQYSDYTNFTASCTASPEDGSFLPSVTLTHEPFQGFTVTLAGRMPLDSSSFGGNGSGEFGPSCLQERGSVSLGARMKF